MGVEQALPHIPRMRRYARLLTGNRERADDLVQDTLERACVKWSLWRPQAAPSQEGSGLRGWLLTLMHNVFVNQVRSAPSETSLDEVAEEAHEPFAYVAERLDLQTALALLSPASREVVLLICVEELSYAEAAQVLGVPAGTVMSRLSRARERLRELMDTGTHSAGSGPVKPALKLVKANDSDQQAP